MFALEAPLENVIKDYLFSDKSHLFFEYNICHNWDVRSRPLAKFVKIYFEQKIILEIIELTNFLPNLLGNKKTSSRFSSLKWTFWKRLNILRFSVASMAVFIPTDKLSTIIKQQSEFWWKSKYMFLNTNWKKSKVNSKSRSKKIRLPDFDDLFSWEKNSF